MKSLWTSFSERGLSHTHAHRETWMNICSKMSTSLNIRWDNWSKFLSRNHLRRFSSRIILHIRLVYFYWLFYSALRAYQFPLILKLPVNTPMKTIITLLGVRQPLSKLISPVSWYATRLPSSKWREHPPPEPRDATSVGRRGNQVNFPFKYNHRHPSWERTIILLQAWMCLWLFWGQKSSL